MVGRSVQYGAGVAKALEITDAQETAKNLISESLDYDWQPCVLQWLIARWTWLLARFRKALIQENELLEKFEQSKKHKNRQPNGKH